MTVRCALFDGLTDLTGLRRTDMRGEMKYQGMTFQAWPEYGCWYEKGKANEMGAMHIPMGIDGVPVFDDMGEVEVLWEEA
jgi:hypothetical protein